MSTSLKRFFEKIGALLASYLYAVGMTLMYAHYDGKAASFGYVGLYTLLAVGVLLIMGLGKRSIWLTCGALIAALLAALLSGWRPLSAIRVFLKECENGGFAHYIDQVALAVSILLLLMSYLLSHDRHGVYVLLTLALIALAVFWFIGHDARYGYAIMPILSLSAFFSVSGALRQSNLKALLSASLIAALLSTALIPDRGVTWQPLEDASEKLLKTVIEFFNLDRNDVEERRTFNLISYGWRMQYDSFGGPARPSREEIMRVKADETLYLRGSIRYTYNNRAWVDESNSDKAGKIKRFMTTGIEGRIYRDEYENAFDLDKTNVLHTYFTPRQADVEIISDNLYWSVYTPGRTEKVDSEDIRIYYNNLGEIFASRQLSEGDHYTIQYYSFEGDDDALSQAIMLSKGGKDRASQAARLLNRDVPTGIDNRVFELVRGLIHDKTNDYEIACAIRDYLRERGTYTLDAEYVPADRDFVSAFVLGDMRGYCMHFAAAMTLMARIAGLPARYVEGYLCQPDESGECLVTGLDAHAWCEVYFDGFGWVTFEATPSVVNGRNGGSQEQDLNDGNTDDDPSQSRFGDDENGDGNEPAPTATLQPTPTPTPEPTPSPTPNNWEENEDENDEWGQDENEGGENDDQDADRDDNNDEDENTSDPDEHEQEGDGEDHENETPNDPNASDHSPENREENGSSLLIIILLAALLLALMIVLAVLRLRQSDPAALDAKAADEEERLIIWYKACLVALKAQGFDFTSGYTPIGFAEKARELKLSGDAFVAFSRHVSDLRYSGKGIKDFDEELARDGYSEIVHRMKPKCRAKWRLMRIKNKLGDLQQVP